MAVFTCTNTQSHKRKVLKINYFKFNLILSFARLFWVFVARVTPEDGQPVGVVETLCILNNLRNGGNVRDVIYNRKYPTEC